jgi:hypothetical protein
MKPYLCPICNGHGIVPGGFYTAMGPYSTSNTISEICRLCGGNGILWSRLERIEKIPKINEILIIGIDFSENGDTGVITVGRQTNGKVDIINVFQGKDAEELYSKLVKEK